jgi:hypothetical protein
MAISYAWDTTGKPEIINPVHNHETLMNGAGLDGYKRPRVASYKVAQTIPFLGYNILEVSSNMLSEGVAAVVRVESPIHIDDLISRLVGLWNTKAGKRIVEHIKDACRVAVSKKLVAKNGNFFFAEKGKVVVRSRNDMKIDPEHIAPDEYRQAVLLILKTGYAFPRKKLIDEVRSLLGFGRTTIILEDLIGRAIDHLLSEGIAGDASAGIALRR